MGTLRHNPIWPVLRSYDGEHLSRIALPLGGIGTGTVSLGGRGDLRDWEIVNRPAKGFTPEGGRNCRPGFVLWARAHGCPAVARLIEGPLELHEYAGASGSTAPNHGLPRFGDCRFAAAYPLAQVLLSDPAVPLAVRIEAFNPLVPGDAEASGIPAAVLRFVLVNRARRAVAAAVCGSLPNFIGTDGSSGRTDGNRNEFRRGRAVRGLLLRSDGVDAAAEQWGTIALATTARAGVTFRTAWRDMGRWGAALLDFWEDFAADGRLNDCAGESAAMPMASLAVRLAVPPRGARAVTFLLAWHFPNRTTWTPRCRGSRCEADRIGNWYATRYADAWDAAERTAADLKRLEARTVSFVRSFCAADLPAEVKEAALFNLSTLRSQTCFRTGDGRLFGWEGCNDRSGCCHGSCTHVWNYEQATAFLFGDLSRSMREVEFLHATDARGRMSFRVNLPLGRAAEHALAAADGQMGCVLKAYRDWQLCGDDAWLRKLWPAVRRAMEFCWIRGGWDADADGVMEGRQHNTMDVEYFGPNPQMGGWYLGALRAAEEMARRLGEADFADRCRGLFERGSRWIDEHLFNGEYYEHEVRLPGGAGPIADGLSAGAWTGTRPDRDDFQLGAGCLVDQLVGQVAAHVCGLGHLLRAGNVRRALRAVHHHNFRRMTGHFNCMRTYATAGERAVLMCTYPRGRRPRLPFPYFTEAMTGFEHAAAVGMLYEGQTAAGLEIIRAIRDRHDGRKRNPFDEAECGHHYARAMASWGAVLALTGFRWCAADAAVQFAAADRPARFFWSNGSAWGTFRQRPVRGGTGVELAVLHGRLRVRTISLGGAGGIDLGRTVAVTPARPLRLVIPLPR